MPKKIIINEQQLNTILESGNYPIDPRKVLLVKDFLDKHFQKASYGNMNARGDWEDTPIVAMKDSKGNPVKNMTDQQLFYYLQSKFNEERHLFGDKEKCDKFIKMVMKAWYAGKIDRLGIIKGQNSY